MEGEAAAQPFVAASAVTEDNAYAVDVLFTGPLSVGYSGSNDYFLDCEQAENIPTDYVEVHDASGAVKAQDRTYTFKILDKNTLRIVLVDDVYFAEGDVIVLKTCSKALGCAAMRIGFAVANRRITDALRAVKSPYNTDSFSQELGAALLAVPGITEKLSGLMVRSRERLYDGICSLAKRKNDIIKVDPSCTNFVFIKMRDSRRVFEALLARSIAVRCFDGYLRITAGTDAENAAVLTALGEILE